MAPAELPSSACYCRKVSPGPTVFPHWNDSHFLSLLTFLLTGQVEVVREQIGYKNRTSLLNCYKTASAILASRRLKQTLAGIFMMSFKAQLGPFRCISLWATCFLPAPYSPLRAWFLQVHSQGPVILPRCPYASGSPGTDRIVNGLDSWYGVQGNTYASSFCCQWNVASGRQCRSLSLFSFFLVLFLLLLSFSFSLPFSLFPSQLKSHRLSPIDSSQCGVPKFEGTILNQPLSLTLRGRESLPCPCLRVKKTQSFKASLCLPVRGEFWTVWPGYRNRLCLLGTKVSSLFRNAAPIESWCLSGNFHLSILLQDKEEFIIFYDKLLFSVPRDKIFSWWNCNIQKNSKDLLQLSAKT